MSYCQATCRIASKKKDTFLIHGKITPQHVLLSSDMSYIVEHNDLIKVLSNGVVDIIDTRGA